MKNKPNILIVDDNPFNRDILADILAVHEFEVDKATNGHEAIDMVMKKKYPIIIMDMLMPKMDGFETTRKLREMGITSAVIAHTSMSMKRDKRRCLEAGCDEFLPKPINIEKLLEFIETFSSPIKDSALEKENEKEQPPASPLIPKDHYQFMGLHLVLVEEDPQIKETYTKFLSSMGFKVTAVSDGDDAIRIINDKSRKADLIISNMFTPGIDGLGVLNLVKRESPHILVFIYAAKFDPATLQLTVQLGADGIIPQSEFENSVADIIQAAIHQASQKDSRISQANTAFQVRKSQARLTQYGCSEQCKMIEMTYATLHDAGGDMAQCRHFNKAGRCGIVLADVSGHDILSSYISAVFLGILSSVWNSHQEPMVLLRTINSELLRLEEVNYHVCTTVILWDNRRKKLKIANAGNPGGFIVTTDSQDQSCIQIKELDGGGLCLGLLDMDNLYVSQEIDFEPGSRLFLFSDGMDTDKMAEILSSKKDWLLDDKKESLCRKILDTYMDQWPQDDDMILLMLEAPPNTPSDGFHYMFKSNYKEVDNACQWITEQITIQNIPANRDIDMMLLSIREALLNAVEHGNNYNPDANVDISMYFKPSELIIEISDEGAGFSFNEKFIEINDGPGFQIGKRGLAIIQAFSDKVDISGGTVILTFKDSEEIT